MGEALDIFVNLIKIIIAIAFVAITVYCASKGFELMCWGIIGLGEALWG